MTGVFLSVPRYSWCTSLSHPSSYACESWTLTAELQSRIQAMEIRCYPKILRISYKDHVTNEEVFQDRAVSWTTQRPPDLFKEMQTVVVWSCLPFIRCGQNHLARHRDRGRGWKITLGKGQAWSSPSPRGQWYQGKMGETGCEIICGDPHG